MRSCILLAALALAGCGNTPDESAALKQNQSVEAPRFIPSGSLVAAASRCRDPNKTGDLVVSTLVTHSDEASWLRQQGCVTIASYEGAVETAYILKGIGAAPDQEVIHQHQPDEVLIHRSDFPDRGQTASAVVTAVPIN
jgi:short subunit dehydrogenase-like uncharacterized protein